MRWLYTKAARYLTPPPLEDVRIYNAPETTVFFLFSAPLLISPLLFIVAVAVSC